MRILRALVLHEDHSPGDRIDGTSSALIFFMSAELPKLRITVFKAQIGFFFTRSWSFCRFQTARSTQMWSFGSTSSALIAIFSDIL